MRPLRLTMTAFGPYAGTETVDFDALTDLGLFVVAGNNGSGKTTIFDALHYCLFGLLPGRRAAYLRLRSDHAPADVGCSVQLDFTAKGKMWRIERAPKQKRPKRRGQGQIEVDRTATLYRFDDDHPVAVANKIGQVNELCRELVGLSGPQFERVALLPQGEFSRVLSQSGTERRELLRALFSSEVFGDASALLNDQAAAATAADAAALDRLELQRAAAATQVSELIGAPADGTETDLLAALTNFRNGELHDLERRAALLGTQADDAARAHQAGIDLLARFKRRHDVTVELAAHHDQLDQYERALERLAQARAAVPVASQARTANQQKARLDDADQRIAALHQRVNRALQVVGLGELAETSELLVEQAARATHAIHDQLIERGNAALTVRDLDVETKRLQGELRRRSNDITVLAERIETTTAQRRQAGLDLERLSQAADVPSCERELANLSALLEQRTELDRCQRADHKLAETLSELRAHCEDLQQRHDVAQDARATSSAQQLTAQAAIDRLTECERRIAAAQRFASATQRLQQLRIDHRNAQAIADDHWDAFIAGTAARVAETLTDDEPCPVCGSADHPEPARPPVGDEIVDESAVARTRAQADRIHDQVRQIEATIEALRATDPAIASLDLNELREDQATAKAKALSARTKADQAHQAAAQLDQLATELASARQAHADLIEQQRTNDQRRHNLQGALGALADQSVVELQTRAQSAADALLLARDAVARHTELTATVAGLDQSIETIGLEQIATENRRSSTADQLADRQHTLQNAQHVLDQIDAAITAMLPQATPASRHGSAADGMVDHEQRAQAARRARELLTGLITELARQHDAAEAVRRAQLILDEKLQQSDFATADQALRAFADPAVVEQLEAQTVAYAATRDQLHGQLQELTDVDDTEPDVHALHRHAEQAADDFESLNRHVITTTSQVESLEADLQVVVEQRESQVTNDLEVRRLERVAALVKGDNDRNTSLENWVLAAHLRDVVELANLRLARSTHQRFQLCVLDDGENRRGKWGLDLGVEDTVTGTRRPTAGLSGGELFQASLALALGLADAVMNQAAGVHIDALFIDEGFGSLDETSVERAIDLLDELRDRGALVGVITHVTALLEALPVGINVVDHATGHGSTIRQAA